MNVPLLDLQAQLAPIEADIKRAVLSVVESGRYIMGPEVEGLEAEIAAYCGSAHAVGVTSGTDALLAALMAFDVGPGDLVVTTPYSFFATAGVVARLNATPVLVDIDPVSYNIDPVALEAWFEANPDAAERVKAVMPVHLYGQCADMDPILAVAARYGVPVIEDGAQAIGATYPGAAGVKKAGAMGAIGCFSFFPSKNLGCLGDGGMLVTDDGDLAEKLRRLRNHGMEPKYYHDLIGGNFRLDAIQAAVLRVKLKHLERWHGMRRENAAFYDAHFTRPEIGLPVTVWGREHHIYNQYIVRIAGGRDGAKDHLLKNQVGCDIYYPIPFHLQACFRYLGYREGDFPHAEKAARETLAIPIYPELDDNMKQRVVDVLEGYFA
ncbi:MAG: DegT/DnrJ/EryC1/StrS family aminotransferase [Candidatus Hydrogenedentes bacterium]|nr:DegT/DnrJ/EryC1/StrS family aminotransferase [Candidatus Hydrogenedentota bacterium]